MGALNIKKVLDALQREVELQRTRGDLSGKVTPKAICDRLKTEGLSLENSTIPVAVSRYLNKAHKEGYVEKERVGRNVFYKETCAHHKPSRQKDGLGA